MVPNAEDEDLGEEFEDELVFRKPEDAGDEDQADYPENDEDKVVEVPELN